MKRWQKVSSAAHETRLPPPPPPPLAMRAFRKGLTAGLRESVDWAASAGAGGGSNTALGSYFTPGDDSAQGLGASFSGSTSASWVPESSECAGDHCLVQVLSATGLGWLGTQTSASSVCVALCVADPAGGSKGRRGVTLPHDKAVSPVWNRCGASALRPSTEAPLTSHLLLLSSPTLPCLPAQRP